MTVVDGADGNGGARHGIIPPEKCLEILGRVHLDKPEGTNVNGKSVGEKGHLDLLETKFVPNQIQDRSEKGLWGSALVSCKKEGDPGADSFLALQL